MNYIKEAENELRNYADMKQSICNIEEELEYIESELTGIKSPNLEDIPGGSSNADDRVCNLLFKKQIKVKALLDTRSEINRIDDILSGLGEDGALLSRWYIDSNPVWKLQNEFNVSERQLYYMKSRAIRRLAIQLFGIKALA